ncbi:MAG: hypothetical protein M0C28_44275 [Candidatus Moduliflexus flocculans]|nr:hypothetical protein [Candidatus Moduliflexus flocculans]
MTLPDSLTTWQVDVRGLDRGHQGRSGGDGDRLDQAVAHPPGHAARSWSAATTC